MAGSERESADQTGQTAALRDALVAETGRKSSVAWVRYPGSGRARPAWHGWTGDAMVLVAARDSPDTAEQPPAEGLVAERPPAEEQRLPGLAAAEEAEVIARAKDGRNRLLTWQARVRVLSPGSEEWDAACAVLGKERLNTTVTIDELPRWWARTATVIRLEPTGEVTEEPGSMDTSSGAAPPPDSAARTTGKLPWVLGRRARGGRPLS